MKISKNKLIQFKLSLMKKITVLLEESGTQVSRMELQVMDSSKKDKPSMQGRLVVQFQTDFDEEKLERLEAETEDEMPDEEYLVGGVPTKEARVRVEDEDEEE
jgi:hypothetical protein